MPIDHTTLPRLSILTVLSLVSVTAGATEGLISGFFRGN
jgi:hypothetical protein